MRALLLAILLVALSGAPHVRANDSVAAHAIGGLELVETADIEMAEEDLFISLDEVRVRYVFINRSAKDITTTVAFPIPDIEINDITTYAFLFRDREDITEFSIRADDKDITFRREVRVFLQSGEEITKALVQAGRELIPNYRGASVDPFASPFSATRTIRIKYFWTQLFPAGKPVTIEHRYRPMAGNFPFPDTNKGINQFLTDIYCVDEAFFGSAYHVIWSLLRSSPYAYAEHVHYILRTANNWRGPIGRFKLTFHLPHRYARLYTCFPGLQDKGGGTYEFEAKNFTPTHDLDLLVLGN
jgi:hypothetical protein